MEIVVYIPIIIVYFAIYSTINNNARYLALSAVAPLGCNAAYDGSRLLTFRDSLSVPSNDQAVSLLNMGNQLPIRCVTFKESEGLKKQYLNKKSEGTVFITVRLTHSTIKRYVSATDFVSVFRYW